MVCMHVCQIVPDRFVQDLRTMMALLQLFCNGRVSVGLNVDHFLVYVYEKKNQIHIKLTILASTLTYVVVLVVQMTPRILCNLMKKADSDLPNLNEPLGPFPFLGGC